jgi:hypothetical protein
VKSPAQVIAELIEALGGIEEDQRNFRSLREANKLAVQALNLVTPEAV